MMTHILGYLMIMMSLSGCITAQLSPHQRRALQVKTFEDTSYNNVFRAFKTVLQDEGYIIKNQDMKGGLIVAHNSKSVSGSYVVLSVMTGDNNYQMGTTYEVSVNLEKIRKNFTESRVIIQQIARYKGGGQHGSEITAPELYRSIYAKVVTEIARRKAKGR